ncbi:RCC1 domain-containing protein [Lapillicoccus jejuensis]|nr:chromosome condensation regulator RCC1 [Lapillicoccus jejuensis]
MASARPGRRTASVARPLGAALVAALALLGALVTPATAYAAPSPSGGLATVVTLERATCGVTAAHGVVCWGADDLGQLGTAPGRDSTVARPVPGLGSGVVSLAAGYAHACAALTSGEVRCWGAGESGQLGTGPSLGAGDGTPQPVPGVSDAVAVSAGGNTSCVLRRGGSVSCWGENVFGSVGDGSTANRDHPVAVSGLAGPATKVSVGPGYACALVSGAVACWGANFDGRLGNGTIGGYSTTAAPVTGLRGATDLSAGAVSACAVVGGGVRCWGSGIFGTLGNGSRDMTGTPVTVRGLSGVTSVVGTSQEVCATTAGGRLWCWGDNQGGIVKVSAGSTTVPVLSPLVGVTAVAPGSRHACAVSSVGATCQGLNGSGMLGDGTRTSSRTPVGVVGLTA